MIFITAPAVQQLKQVMAEHPEDPVVRIVLEELGDNRRAFRITLEAAPQPADQVQEVDGLTIAIESKSAARMDGVTVDYLEHGGFTFHHPQVDDDDAMPPISLN